MSLPCNLKRIEYTVVHGGHYEEKRVAMFNSTVISPEEVTDYINKELIDFEYNPKIVTMTYEQYCNLQDIEPGTKEIEQIIDKNIEFLKDLVLEQQGGII